MSARTRALQLRWSKFRILMTMICGIAIVAVFVRLKLGNGVFLEKEEIVTYVGDATGITSGNPVRLNGVRIGKIRTVRFAEVRGPNREVRVGMQIEERFLPSIPADSQTEIASENLIGDKFINITRGNDTQVLRPGGELRFQPQPDLIKNADLTQLQERLRLIDQQIKDIEEGKGPLGEFVRSDAMYRDVVTQVNTVAAAFEHSIGTQSPIGKLIYRTDDLEQMRIPIKRLDDQLAQIEAGQGMGEFIKDPKMYNNLVQAVADLRKTIRNISAMPMVANDELYTNLLQQLITLHRRLDEIRVSPMVSGYQPQESLIGGLNEWGKTIKEFRQNPQKFLRIQIF